MDYAIQNKQTGKLLVCETTTQITNQNDSATGIEYRISYPDEFAAPFTIWTTHEISDAEIILGENYKGHGLIRCPIKNDKSITYKNYKVVKLIAIDIENLL